MYYSAETIERLIEKHCSYVNVADEYGEPGYTRNFPNMPIFFADWNSMPKKVRRWLEDRINLEWEDEWVISYNYPSKAYRTQPDCWSWTPSYIANDWTNGEIIGRDEMEASEDLQKSYIEEYLLDDPHVCDMFDLDYSKFGFEQINGEFENGWYHRDDNPEEVLKYWQEKLPDYEFIFGNYSNEQFRCNFNLYGRKRQ